MCEVFERRFSLINSSHRYSTQPNYRLTPNYPTKTKARVPLSLFVALRLFLRADSRSRSTYHLFFPKEQKCAGLERFGEKCAGLRFFSQFSQRRQPFPPPFLIRDNESDHSQRVVRLDAKFAEEERERET